MSSLQPATWRAPAGCPSHLVPALERAVQAFPPNWLLSPEDGEQFDTVEEGERRLAAFALSQGFDIVKTSTGSKQWPSHSFAYIFYG